MKTKVRIFRVLSLLMCVAMLFSFMGIAEKAIAAPVHSGTYGTCEWEISDEGVLTIKDGQLPDYTNVNNIPWYKHRELIKSVVVEDGVKTADNAGFLFYGLVNATTMDISRLDTSQTTKFNNMFANCRSIKEIDISNLNTDKATTISRMFNDCRSLESIDVSKINTANTTELVAVFERCYKLKEIKGLESWDVSKVKNLNSIFRETSIKDLSGIEKWDVSSLIDLNSAFYRCSVQSLDLSAWDVSNLESLHYGFARSGLTDLNITGWDLTGLNSQSHAFEYTGIKKLDIAKWNNSNISEGYPRENAFVGMPKLQEIKLNPKFVFHGNDGFNTTPPTDETYTGKWQAVGEGTVDNPQGEVFTVEELRALYSAVDKGPLETYVWEKVKPVTVDSVHFIIHIVNGTADKDLLEQMNPKLKDGEGNEFTPSGIMENGYTFEFKDIPVGKYTLTFEYPTGYKFKGGVTADNIPYLDTGSEVDINQLKDSDFYTRLEKIKDDPEYTSIEGQKTWLKDKESDRP